MKVERITHSQPRCDAARQTVYTDWYEERHPDKRCRFRGKYLIDGKHYCARHAGQIALDHLVGETSNG